MIISNIKGLLELELPIPFYDICKIYPVNIQTMLEMSDDIEFNKLFTPYIMTKESIKIDVDVFDVLMGNSEYTDIFIKSIMYLTHESDVMSIKDMLLKYLDDKTSYADILERLFDGYEDINLFISEKNCIVINGNKFINKDNFDEFADIVRISQEIHIPEPTVEPVFQSDQGRQAWLRLQEARAKYKRNDKTMSLENIINVVQFGKESYIPSKEIKEWSMWKLMNAYRSILNKDNYDKTFTASTNGFGSKDKNALKKHWSELLKVT